MLLGGDLGVGQPWAPGAECKVNTIEQLSAKYSRVQFKHNCVVSIAVKVDPESLKSPAFCSYSFKRTGCSTGKGHWIFVISG